MEKVVDNFLLGLKRLKIRYTLNDCFNRTSQPVISFGLGKLGLSGVNKEAPLLAAIGFPLPIELPDLEKEYNLFKFIQHSDWVINLSKSCGVYNANKFASWPAGIDTDYWHTHAALQTKSVDVLIYNKLYWETERYNRELAEPIRQFLIESGYRLHEIRYGNYEPEEYHSLLGQCKVMIFLSAHESQGFAYLEALSAGVPVFAWNQGFWLDPKRIELGLPAIKASSIPFFDERCGGDFRSALEFEQKFPAFFDQASGGRYQPRDYVLEHLTIEKSTRRLLDIYHSI